MFNYGLALFLAIMGAVFLIFVGAAIANAHPIDKFVGYLIKRAKRTPYSHISGYMNRWWLLPYSKRRPAIRIHEILRSDDERAFHDHPWNFISVILRGGYTEVRPMYDESGLYLGDDRVWYPPGSIIFRRAKDFHRLELRNNTPAWTLFITFKYKQHWGFRTDPAVKIYHRDYPDRQKLKDAAALNLSNRSGNDLNS